jgi:hypothetical protein
MGSELDCLRGRTPSKYESGQARSHRDHEPQFRRDVEDRRAAGRRPNARHHGSSACHYDPEKYNFANAIRISKEVGYKGLFSIETASNDGPDPHAATKTILDELNDTCAGETTRIS